MTQTPVPQNEDMSERLSGNIARLVERRREEDATAPLSERIATRITRFAGSMSFIVGHVIAYGGALLVMSGLLPIPFPWEDGLSIIGSIASTEAIFLSLFVLMNQRREGQLADRRSDLDLHVSLLTEDELTKLAEVIRRMAEKMGVPLDAEKLDEVEKNVDPEHVLDAIEQVEESHDGDAPRGAPAMKDSTAS